MFVLKVCINSIVLAPSSGVFRSFPTLAGCPTVHLSSNSVYLERARWRAQPHKRAPTPFRC